MGTIWQHYVFIDFKSIFVFIILDPHNMEYEDFKGVGKNYNDHY